MKSIQDTQGIKNSFNNVSASENATGAVQGLKQYFYFSLMIVTLHVGHNANGDRALHKLIDLNTTTYSI